MVPSAVLLFVWSALEGHIAMRFLKVGDLRTARTHGLFAAAMAAIGAVLVAVIFISS